MAVRVIRFPETTSPCAESALGSVKRRAAAYARVSSDHDDQTASCAVQVDYYTSYIQSRDDLEFVKVYTDEGISGTSTARRAGFNQMIADALDGKIDLIITKSVSRFARNTVDGLSAIRLLKENKVECYFERENIRTFDSKGELLLTIMASIAQEEARSVSENCTWGQRKRFADGKVTVPFKRFLGYERGSDGGLIVSPLQAETVREIYDLFLSGMSPYAIAKLLTERNIPSPGGKAKWYKATVTSILSNEKYKGDALLQKVYTTDYLTKRKKLNTGELPQFYVEGDHEPIIAPELFEQARLELDRRRAARQAAVQAASVGKRKPRSVKKPISSAAEPSEPLFLPKLFCGKCGSPFSARTLYSTNNFSKTLMECPHCADAHITASEAESLFIEAVNRLIPRKNELIASSALFCKRLESTKALKAARAELTAKPDSTSAANGTNSANSSDSTNDANSADKLAALDRRIDELTAQKLKMRLFRKALKRMTAPLCEFDKTLFPELVDRIVCTPNNEVRVIFNDGTQIELRSS